MKNSNLNLMITKNVFKTIQQYLEQAKIEE